MRPVTTFVVNPTMPAALAPLKELAYNFWWCWHADAIELFHRIDPVLWEETHHNPVAMLALLSNERLNALAERAEYVANLTEVYQEFRSYMDSKGWYSSIDATPGSFVAYFCAEFGIHESFSNYSGGLGVLAGDHLKSASDLGVPLVAVGLLYQEGYFRQYLTQNGWQNEMYSEIDFFTLPLTPVTRQDGSPLMITVDVPLGTLHAQIWKLNVGRVPLYLLDTNVPQNVDPSLRDVSDRLYGGTTDTRVMQEMLLGIGGMRMLAELGIEPAACHVNEGHAAFSMLERTRMTMLRLGMTFREAWRITQSSTVFTTHTPVPAGNEIFHFDVIERYFKAYVATLGISWAEFLELGTQTLADIEDGFSMTVLGLKGSTYRNGVSKLHGAVARQMWNAVWPQFSLEEVPIGAVTNGVHTGTWVGSELAHLYDRYLSPKWRTHPEEDDAWENVERIPSFELWRVHQRRRERLVIAAREHILSKHHASLTQEQASKIHDFLDPDILTIGFARRFATYKRADLLMRDMDRLASLVTDPQRPMQVIMAGKAHPRDTAGKELIQHVLENIRNHGLEHRIVFLEDYDMHVARLMVRGCDVWLNTPRRPYEASGTSGMKSIINGGLHFSVLDGWWAEAYDGHNGFAIGRGEEMLDPDEQDTADAGTLYDTIEHAIKPMFYERNKGKVPERWVDMMKHSIRTLAPEFSSLRMVRDYATKNYVQATQAYRTMTENGGERARSMVQYFDRVAASWPSVRVGEVNIHGGSGAYVGKHIHLNAEVRLGALHPNDVIVQAVYGRVDAKGEINPAHTTTLAFQREDGGTSYYEGDYVCQESGMQGCTVRVTPTHEQLIHVADTLYCTYAS
jgi:starch phosphorylase